MVVPPISTPKWSFLVGKPMGVLGKPTILVNPHIFRTENLPIFHGVFGVPKHRWKTRTSYFFWTVPSSFLFRELANTYLFGGLNSSCNNQQKTLKTWHWVLKSHWIEVSILATIGWLEHHRQFRLLCNHRRFRFQSHDFIEKRNEWISEFSNDFMI